MAENNKKSLEGGNEQVENPATTYIKKASTESSSSQGSKKHDETAEAEEEEEVINKSARVSIQSAGSGKGKHGSSEEDVDNEEDEDFEGQTMDNFMDILKDLEALDLNLEWDADEGEEEEDVEFEEPEVIEKKVEIPPPQLGPPELKKLDISYLSLLSGTAIASQAKAQEAQHGKAGEKGKAAPGKKKNENIVYGGDPDDDDNDFDDDQDFPDFDSTGNDSGGSEEDDDEEDEVGGHRYSQRYHRGSEYDFDEMWEDDETMMGEGEDDTAAILFAEQMERERRLQERLTEIKRKKEILVERYLKSARIMINHRKKNIYLQDYLFHLALRKGVLRGDQSNFEDSQSTMTKNYHKKKLKKKNAVMATKFARFLQKTGHYMKDEEGHAVEDHHHHHHHHHHEHENHFRKSQFHHHHHHHNHHLHLPRVSVRKTFFGKDGGLFGIKNKILGKGGFGIGNYPHHHIHHKTHKTKGTSAKSGSAKHAAQNARLRPLTLKEQLELKAAATLKAALKTTEAALQDFEHHRCKTAKKKQLIKITKLLERLYGGISPLHPERNHLVSFVERSLNAQNLAKKKALRQQKKPEKSAISGMHHQWIKSLDRIRELRIQKAKLEQEHRHQLITKVKHWHIWEKRDLVALEAVFGFITRMSSRIIMSKRETETFSLGLEQFRKQLHALFDSMLEQLVRVYKAKSMLCMARRKVKDNSGVLSMKGFTINDYERMIIENNESHEKLNEKQNILISEHDKLLKYLKQVAKSHAAKQRSWGSLRAGRHDTKALWEMCAVERDNLLKKLKEVKKAKKVHKKLFMQISILENKRCFVDFQRVKHRVYEYTDKRRSLQTQLLQNRSGLRALNVKLHDIQERHEIFLREKVEKKEKDDMTFCKATITNRLHPKQPNTVYSVNIPARKSIKVLLQKDTKPYGSGKELPRVVTEKKKMNTIYPPPR